jgi:ADP-heptose:LPS heptosyltransferase
MDKQLPAGSRLTLIAKSATVAQFIGLVQWRSRVHTICLAETGLQYYAALAKIAVSLRWRRPSVYVALHAGDRLTAAAFSRVVGASLSVGPEGAWASIGYSKVVQWPPGLHKVDYYLRFAEAASLGGKEWPNTPLRISEEKRIKAKTLLQSNGDQKVIAVAPGASPVEVHKLWGLDQYRELINKLLGEYQDTQIVVFGGAEERAKLNYLAACDAARVSVVAEDDIETSLAVLERVACLVSTCGGAAHMAALLGIPIVALYGPTNPSITGPFTKRLRIVHKAYRCSPCYRPGFETGCGTPHCIQDILVDDVLEAIELTLRGSPFPAAPKLFTTRSTLCDARPRIAHLPN